VCRIDECGVLFPESEDFDYILRCLENLRNREEFTTTLRALEYRKS
jgi:hypothetical protein